LEQQLIDAISKNLLDPRLEQQRIRDFSAQLKATIELEEQLAFESASNTPKLTAERADLEKQAVRLVDAIGQHGYSSFLSGQLSNVESRIAEIDRLLSARPASKLPTFIDEQIAEFLRQECQDFCDALTGDPEFARQQTQKRIKKLGPDLERGETCDKPKGRTAADGVRRDSPGPGRKSGQPASKCRYD
jgi:hypothetical protein